MASLTESNSLMKSEFGDSVISPHPNQMGLKACFDSAVNPASARRAEMALITTNDHQSW